MLTLAPVSGGMSESGYYRAEGYYKGEGGPDTSYYLGKAAEEFGFEGKVDDEKFAKLLEGYAPNEQVMGRVRNDQREHRSGLDMTFSAPKSVSLAALVGGDRGIIDAHNQAVKVAFDYVEAHVAQTRVARDGIIEVVPAKKLMAAAFVHEASRALDPQLHTHVVATNMVLGDDGRFRALHNDEIYRLSLVVGQLYRNELAKGLEARGHELVRDNKGFFELANISRDVIDHFSKRRAEILHALDNRNLEATAKQSQLAALATRSAKEPVKPEEIYRVWREEARSVGYEYTAPTPSKSKTAINDDRTPDQRARDSVAWAVWHLSERQSVYTEAQIISTAISHEPKVHPNHALRAVNDGVNDRNLFRTVVKGKDFLTDSETVQAEKKNLAILASMRGGSQIDVRSFREKLFRSEESAVSERLRNTSLTIGQRDAVSLILTSQDRLVGIQGLAGTGKTYMLETAARHLGKADFKVEGIAPSHKAVGELAGAIGDARTIESTLLNFDNGKPVGDKSKTVLFIDEASMISSKNMNRLLDMATERGYARVVLVGDIKQLAAVEAGVPFRQLQEAGMAVALMADVQRQNTIEGRAAVVAASRGLIKDAFEGISKIHTTGGGRPEIASETASQWLASHDRDRTGIVVTTNEIRREVNRQVQEGLLSEGKLHGKSVEVETLLSREFTAAEKAEIGSYSKGDIIVSYAPIRGAGIAAGDRYTVTDIKPDERRLMLKSEDGSQETSIVLNKQNSMTKKLGVFTEDRQEFYAGDRVKFKITDRDVGIFNSHEGEIIRFQNGAAVIEDKTFERVLVPLESLAAKGMQLAYSATAHDYQGSSVDRVLLAMESSGQLANQQAFYVGLSRMRDDTQLITDDPAKLQRNIERQTGEKIAALDGLEKTAPQSTGKTASEEAKIRDEKEAQIDPKTSPEQTSIFDVLNGRDRDPESPQISKDDHEKDPRKDQSVRDLLGDFPRPEMPADVQRQLDQWNERLEREKGERTR